MPYKDWDKPRKTVQHLSTKHPNNLVVGFHDGASSGMEPHYEVHTPRTVHHYNMQGKKVKESTLHKPKKKRLRRKKK